MDELIRIRKRKVIFDKLFYSNYAVRIKTEVQNAFGKLIAERGKDKPVYVHSSNHLTG